MLLSKIVVRRKKNARAVMAAIAIHAALIARQLELLLAPLRPEGRETSNFMAVIEDLRNLLVRDTDRLERADWAHLAEVVNDRRLRRTRDQSTDRLHQTLTFISGTIDNTYGGGIAEEVVGLGTGLRAVPDQMLELASRVDTTLGEPEFSFPEASLDGVQLDPAELQGQIREPLTDLEQAIKDLNEGKKEFDKTLKAKQLALEAFDRTYSQVAAMLKSMLLLIGEDLHAKRIRPTVPQASPPEDGEVVEVDENGDEIEGAEPADPQLADPPPADPPTEPAS